MKIPPVLIALTFTVASSFALSAAVHYVNVQSGNPVPPYTNWATAAQTIQDAVDAAFANVNIVVARGVYKSGGRTTTGMGTSRIVVDKPLILQSLNGPQATAIEGYQVKGVPDASEAIRCARLTKSVMPDPDNCQKHVALSEK